MAADGRRSRTGADREPGPHPRAHQEAHLTFGEQVRKWREGKRVTLRAFAKAAQLSPTYLSKLERGLMRPPSEKAVLGIVTALRGLGVIEADADRLLGLACRVPKEVREQLNRKPEMVLFMRRATTLSRRQLRKETKRLEEMTEEEESDS